MTACVMQRALVLLKRPKRWRLNSYRTLSPRGTTQNKKRSMAPVKPGLSGLLSVHCSDCVGMARRFVPTQSLVRKCRSTKPSSVKLTLQLLRKRLTPPLRNRLTPPPRNPKLARRHRVTRTKYRLKKRTLLSLPAKKNRPGLLTASCSLSRRLSSTNKLRTSKLVTPNH